jgi:hypothetical protein
MRILRAVYVLAPMAEAIHADRAQRWAVEQRGFWVHDVDTLAEYLRATVPFDLDGRLSSMRCPTAVTEVPDSGDRRRRTTHSRAVPSTSTTRSRAPRPSCASRRRRAPATTARCATAASPTSASTTGSTPYSEAEPQTRAGRLRFSQEMRRRGPPLGGPVRYRRPDARGVLEKAGARVTR